MRRDTFDTGPLFFATMIFFILLIVAMGIFFGMDSSPKPQKHQTSGDCHANRCRVFNQRYVVLEDY